MRKFRKVAGLTIAAAAALAGTVATSSPAMAASTPIGACGGGSYHEIDKHDLGAATIHLLYNGKTNCVVTWKDNPNGAYVLAQIRVAGGGWHSDGGFYSTYAGPVKVSAAGKCIQWRGSYSTGKVYESPVEHCG